MYNVRHIQLADESITKIYSRIYYHSDTRCNNRLLLDNPFDNFEYYDFSYILNDKQILDNQERSRMVSRRRAIANIYHLAKCNYWSYFVTITFNPNIVDSFDYAACSSKLSQWLKDLRKADSSLIYLFVPELHVSGRWHFHGLLSCDSSKLKLVDSGKTDSSGKKIYNIGRYKFGFTTCTEVVNSDACAKYITKYITKDLISHIKGKKHFWASRNLSRPVISEEFCDKDDLNVLSCLLDEVSVEHDVSVYSAGDVLSPQRCDSYTYKGEHL